MARIEYGLVILMFVAGEDDMENTQLVLIPSFLLCILVLFLAFQT